jgi:Asparagine synthase
MYFTLAISATTRDRCAALVSAAASTDPRVMPIPGPPVLVWRSPDERAAVLGWPAPDGAGTRSHAGTIWADDDGLHARTGVTRVDPVYLAEVPGAVLVSDRASWAAAIAGRLAEPDPVTVTAFLSLGYPVGGATPFRGVRALAAQRQLTVDGGRPVVTAARRTPDVTAARRAEADAGDGSYGAVAAALVDAIRPLGEQDVPVELSLTGGKDSRLIAAALTAAKVPFRARTHGFASHPDVIVAAMIARQLGVEHVVTEPRAAAPEQAPDEADVLARLRSAVLVSDGMLSAFENVGRPDPHVSTEPVQTGGHGGELLRGGYAPAAWSQRRPARAWSEARGAELFRRMVTRRTSLVHPAAARAYLASLAPFAASLPRGPLHTLDDFYLVNRAGRWSAAARQAYLLREPLVQPLFGDRVVLAARAVPLPDRITDRLHRGVLQVLCPELLDLPLAGSVWKSGPQIPPVRASAVAGAAADAGAQADARAGAGKDADWRRAYGDQMARLLRDYTLDLGAAGGMFDIVRRSAAERALAPPQPDPHAAWALATLAVLLSGDWLNARSGTNVLSPGRSASVLSPGRSASQPARRTPLPPAE